MASNRIKGITIEIGGDTTKLDKALRSTDTQLNKTKTNLKDVERLLKLDPGNTELLAQKQRLLADAMEGTRQRAETLKAAVEQADAQLARNVEFGEKYGPLLKSLDEATAAYDALKAKQEEMDRALALGDIPTEQYDKWQAEMNESATYLKGLRQQVREAKEEMGGPMMDQAQFDSVQREYMESQKAAEDAEKAFKNFNTTTAEISANADKVAQGASKVAEATKGISAAAGVAAGGLVAMAVNAGKAADDLNTLSKQSGFSTETLQEWTYAADLVDVSVDDIVSAARRMKKNMASESAEVQEAWRALGMSVTDNTGQFRDAEGIFYDLIGNLSLIQNETERDTIAMTLLGKSADQLAGIIDDGGDALRQLGKEAHDAGLILSQDALDGANAFNDELDTLKAKAKAAFMESGASLAENLLPVLESAAEALSSLLEWFAHLDPSTLQFLLQVLLAVAGIAPVASAISAIAGAVSTVSTAVGLLTGGLGALNIAGAGTLLIFGKWVLIIGAVVAAVWLLVQAFNALRGSSSNVDMPDIPDVPTGSGGRGGGSGRSTAYSLPTVTAEDLPHLAQGAVTRANSPFMAVVGDNPSEPEIIAPYSTIKQAARDAMAEGGGGRTAPVNLTATMTVDGVVFGRLIAPYIDGYNSLRSPNLVVSGTGARQ